MVEGAGGGGGRRRNEGGMAGGIEVGADVGSDYRKVTQQRVRCGQMHNKVWRQNL